MGAILELPGKQHNQSGPFPHKLDWIGFAGNSQTALTIFFIFSAYIFFYFFWYETIETHAFAFLTHIILAISGVSCDNTVYENHKKIWYVYHGFGETMKKMVAEKLSQ